MKKAILSIAFLLMLSLVSFGQQTKTAEIKFATTEHDFGTIPHAGDGTFDFIFHSTGKEPVILSRVQTSCGCTTPSYSKEPVKSGQPGIVKVHYDTNRTGAFTKTVTVYSNAKDSVVTLTIKGVVEAEKKQN
jgi:hypothetical protein